jgi:polygalacturonase
VKKMQKCGIGKIWDGSKKRCIKDNAPHTVGDGKLPNKYWVSAHNEYQVLKEEDGVSVSHAISEIDKEFKTKGGTLAVFETFEEAVQYAEEIPVGIDEEMRTVTIEDRLSGEVFSIETTEYEVHRKEYAVEARRHTKFTEEKMREKGHSFR